MDKEKYDSLLEVARRILRDAVEPVKNLANLMKDALYKDMGSNYKSLYAADDFDNLLNEAVSNKDLKLTTDGYTLRT